MKAHRIAIAASVLALVIGTVPAIASDGPPSGTISIDETQFGFLLGGSTGGGELTFNGKRHHFTIGGISVGDIGASKVRGTGHVYHMTKLSEFDGTYSKLDASATAIKGEGALQLKNDHGVVLEIHTTSKGLQLSAGAGGVKIKLS